MPNVYLVESQIGHRVVTIANTGDKARELANAYFHDHKLGMTAHNGLSVIEIIHAPKDTIYARANLADL
jgi:hypothetical protein